MKTADRSVLYNEISRFNKPTVRLLPGETLRVETELNTGGWLHSIDDVWAPDLSTGNNPSSGCIYVEGATPEHTLVVRILDIQLGALGYTGFAPGMNPFPDWIRQREWGVVTKTVRIENDHVLWNNRLKIPVQPMIGLVGTAPALGVPDNTQNGRHGGNLDIQEITTGSTVYLPVFVEGALLHVGDVHAIQGDGEVCCGGGIETRGVLTLQLELAPKPAGMTWPRIETGHAITTVGCARPAEDAFRIAVQELIRWMVADHGFGEREALLLLGQVLHARCTQFVDPLYTYIATIRKDFLLS